MSAAKLLPCIYCGSPAVLNSKVAQCEDLKCYAIGPEDDADGAKWNSAHRTPSPVVGMSDGELIARAILALAEVTRIDGGVPVADAFTEVDLELDRRAEARKGGGNRG